MKDFREVSESARSFRHWSELSFKGSSRYQSEVSECSSHSSHRWDVLLLDIKELEAPVREDRRQEQEQSMRIMSSLLRNMTLLSLLSLLSLPPVAAHPLQNTNQDIDVLQFLLKRLEASIQDQTKENVEEELIHLKELQPQAPPDDSEVRRGLSTQDLMVLRRDTKRHSGCFGSRLDRIGSMSTLGCKTAGRSGPKKK
ncbi:hypothetical protein DNTS_015399 [Danionella cerebrum]|uniref:Brain natriuretic factor prohormone n=1 Tax=Danionella cerebrum TaxID=2873325 RepID=A0A553R3R3_9TELE|nr:hypothetical protein DNTS_015399 [Danionella translucida]